MITAWPSGPYSLIGPGVFVYDSGVAVLPASTSRKIYLKGRYDRISELSGRYGRTVPLGGRYDRVIELHGATTVAGGFSDGFSDGFDN